MGSLDKDHSRSLFLLRITDPSFCFCSHLVFSHPRDTTKKERIAAFWNIDPAVRTFQVKAKDSQEVSSGSFTMSSKYSNLYMIKYLNECKTRILICVLDL
ncbi:hypothetical protein Hanom_Chr00s002188g01692991 [Helianthus anomalus]